MDKIRLSLSEKEINILLLLIKNDIESTFGTIDYLSYATLEKYLEARLNELLKVKGIIND